MNGIDPPPLGMLLDSQSRLRREFQDLARRWVDVKDHWRDAQRDEFERKHLAELPAVLSRADAALQELDEALRKAERQLSDETSET